jgi:hypothetical protein
MRVSKLAAKFTARNRNAKSFMPNHSAGVLQQAAQRAEIALCNSPIEQRSQCGVCQ